MHTCLDAKPSCTNTMSLMFLARGFHRLDGSLLQVDATLATGFREHAQAGAAPAATVAASLQASLEQVRLCLTCPRLLTLISLSYCPAKARSCAAVHTALPQQHLKPFCVCFLLKFQL